MPSTLYLSGKETILALISLALALCSLPPAVCLLNACLSLPPSWSVSPPPQVPIVKSGKKLMISAHGNTLRALVKHLDDIPEVQSLIPLLPDP